MTNVTILLAAGFEEAEALVPADLLLRAGAKVTLASVDGSETVTGSHGFRIGADCSIDAVDRAQNDLLILPGGKLGTDNLFASIKVRSMIQDAVANGKLVAAICAAPSILGRMGLLEGRKYACYPGFEPLVAGGIYTGKKVEQDDIFVTAEGMGVADEFGFYLIGLLFGTEKEAEIRESVRK